MIRDAVQTGATHPAANAAAAIVLGAYLATVLYQGQLPALAQAAEQDFIGSNGKPAFWKWAVAVVILYALASNPSTNHLFGPILVIAIAAMFIDLAQTGQLSQVASAFNTVLSNKAG